MKYFTLLLVLFSFPLLSSAHNPNERPSSRLCGSFCSHSFRSSMKNLFLLLFAFRSGPLAAQALLLTLTSGLLHPLSGAAQTNPITPVAGTGTPGVGGDGGTATSAPLASPFGVAVDGGGNLFIADQGFSRIRKVSPAGVITTVAGTGKYGVGGDGGAATSAQLADPMGVAVDGSGNLFIADRNSSRIRKVSASGVITTVAGTGAPGFSGDGGAATSAQHRLDWRGRRWRRNAPSTERAAFSLGPFP